MRTVMELFGSRGGTAVKADWKALVVDCEAEKE